MTREASRWLADRYDFGKFVDVHDVYFGNYASLVDLNESGIHDEQRQTRGRTST